MDKLVENHVPIESVVSEPPIQNFPESDYVNVKIEFNNNKKETEVRFSEKKAVEIYSNRAGRLDRKIYDNSI